MDFQGLRQRFAWKSFISFSRDWLLWGQYEVLSSESSCCGERQLLVRRRPCLWILKLSHIRMEYLEEECELGLSGYVPSLPLYGLEVVWASLYPLEQVVP